MSYVSYTLATPNKKFAVIVLPGQPPTFRGVPLPDMLIRVLKLGMILGHPVVSWPARYHFISGYTAKVAGTEAGQPDSEVVTKTSLELF